MGTNVDYKTTDAEVDFTITLEGIVKLDDTSLKLTEEAEKNNITKEDIFEYFKNTQSCIEKEEGTWFVELKLPKNNISGKGEIIAYDFEKAFKSYDASILKGEMPTESHFEVTKNPDSILLATVDVLIYSRQTDYWLDIDVEDEYANPEGADPIETIHVEVEPK